MRERGSMPMIGVGPIEELLSSVVDAGEELASEEAMADRALVQLEGVLDVVVFCFCWLWR